MSTRYIKTFSTKANLYCENSPIIVQKGAINFDTRKSLSIAQIKFKNISDKTITKLSVSLKVSGPEENQKESIDFVYDKQNVGSASSFGEKMPILLPFEKSKSFEITAISVKFEDGTIWSNEENIFVPLKQKKITKLLPNYYQLIAYADKFGKGAKRIATDYDNFWLCTCSEACHFSESECPKCKASREELQNIDSASLLNDGVYLFANKKSNSKKLPELKAAKEALNLVENSEEKAELLEKISQKITIKKAKNTKVALAISIPSVISVIALVLLFAVFLPLINAVTYSFNTNGGSYCEPIRSDKAIVLPTPTKENAHFLGWYTDFACSESSKLVSSVYRSDKDVTLYAKWQNYVPITLNSPSQFYATPDGVYFIFTPTKSGYYVFESDTDNDNYDVDGTLYKTDMTLLKSDTSQGDFRMRVYLNYGQQYLLVVKSYGDACISIVSVTN